MIVVLSPGLRPKDSKLRALLKQTSISISADFVERDSSEESRVVFISELSDWDNFASLQKNKSVTAVFPLREESLDEDVIRSAGLLKNAAKPGDSVILANHQDGADSEKHLLTSSEERWPLIDRVGEFGQKRAKEVFSEFPDILMTVASELLTNAFYNAPRDEKDKAIVLDRTEGVSLNPPKHVEFAFGDDSQHIWMKITDPFGTLDRDKLLRHLMKCASKDELEVNQGPGGAGIGIFMVFRWASQLLFYFEPGKETIVMAKLIKTRRHRVFDSQRAILEIIQK